MITNCGDFQVAHRDLWYKSRGFAIMHGHKYADSDLQARWLSQGATIQVLDVAVQHVSHDGNRNDPSKLNPQPEFLVEQSPDRGWWLTSTWEFP